VFDNYCQRGVVICNTAFFQCVCLHLYVLCVFVPPPPKKKRQRLIRWTAFSICVCNGDLLFAVRMEWAAGVEGLTNPRVQASDALSCAFCHFSCIQFRFLACRTFRQTQAVSMYQFVGYHSDIVEFSSRWYDVVSLGNRITTFRFTIVVSFSGMEISKEHYY